MTLTLTEKNKIINLIAKFLPTYDQEEKASNTLQMHLTAKVISEIAIEDFNLNLKINQARELLDFALVVARTARDKIQINKAA